MDKLQQKIKHLPTKPGVYLFKDKTGGVIYVGKAQNLRSRVRQYFQGHDDRPQIPYLLKDLADVDYVVVKNELESLFLEINLIKRHSPKYNIELKDDKSYAFLAIDYSTQIPQIVIKRRPWEKNAQFPIRLPARQVSNFQTNSKFKILRTKPQSRKLKTGSYFGPFVSVKKIRDLIFTTRKIFGFCAAKEVGNRPCFYYHLHRCPGVCIGKVSLKDYKQHLENLALFLAGHTEKVFLKLKRDMLNAAKHKQFETAARLRDQLKALHLLQEKQAVIFTTKVDWDVVATALSGTYGCINLFKIRLGKMVDKENFIYDLKSAAAVPSLSGELLEKFLEDYYLQAGDVPKQVYVPLPVANERTLQDLLLSRLNKKVKFSVPKKGRAFGLVNLSATNAQEYLQNYLTGQAGHLDKISQALLGLKDLLHLPNLPKRIEGYDISNIQGTNAVGSMVVFKDGQPAKSEYRRFKIYGKTTPDDFAMMREMIIRRLAHLQNVEKSQKPNSKNQTNLKSKILNPKSDKWPLPDLIVIDGGKGQLSAALAAMSNIKFQKSNIPVIGLAKRLEEIFVPGRKTSIILPKDSPILQLLQRLRDEAHRFGLTFHRLLRSKQATRSALDEIAGVGPKTKALLKQKIGTVAAIKKTSIEELTKIVGRKKAQKIKRWL